MDNRKRKVKKKSSNKLLVAIIIIALITFAIFLISKQYKYFDSKSMTSDEIQENSYTSSKIMRIDLNNIKTISFDLKTTDVRIQRSSTNPYIEYTKLYKNDENIYDLRVNIDNGNIDIKSDVKGKELIMKNKIQILRIFLPMEGSIDEVKGKIGAGQIKISDLEAKKVDLLLESGNINIENSYINGNVINNAGNINLINSEMSKGSLSSKAGNINVEDIKMTGDMSFETDIGSISVTTEDPINKFDILARLNVGNFVLGNVSYRNIKDGYMTENDAQIKISLKTRVGDISFNKGEGAVQEKEEIYSSPASDEEIEDNENQTTDENIITPVDDSIFEQNSKENINKENQNN